MTADSVEWSAVEENGNGVPILLIGIRAGIIRLSDVRIY